MNRPDPRSTPKACARPQPTGPVAHPHRAPAAVRGPVAGTVNGNGHSGLKRAPRPPEPASATEPFRPDSPGRLPAPEDLELKLLLEAVYLKAGLDFRNYLPRVVRERVAAVLRRERLGSISQLQAAVLRQPEVFERLLVGLTERRTCLFQEPALYRLFRQEIAPWLRTYPFARLWVAGCGGGAEAYSLAVLLFEAGLQERCRIYATDLCEPIVRHARAGLVPRTSLKRAAANYKSAGGTRSFIDYHTLHDGQARLAPDLGRNIVFAAHNLMTDASFNEFQFILCREAMADFDPILQAQAHELLYASLVPRGVLALGRRHRHSLTLRQSQYEALFPEQGIYRKKWPN